MIFETEYITRKIILLLLGVIIATPPVIYGEDGKTYELEAITVTVDKREENAQEVPAAVTVLTETDLEDAGIENIGDVMSQVPNLTIHKIFQGYSDVNFRGLGISPFTSKNPVVIYVDGIPLDHQVHYDADLINVERVEVLRGPQGALYGKNAIGGIINVISKKPENTCEAKVSAEIGEDETYGLKAFVNGPVVRDRLFLGLSGKVYETRGFMKKDFPDQDYFGAEEMRKAKALLRWLPVDRLDINLHAGIDQKRDGGGMLTLTEKISYNDNETPDDKFNTDIINSALNINYTTEFADFKSVTTYSETETDMVAGYSFKNGPIEFIDISDSTTLTQEFRIQSPERDDGLKWLGGIYYSMEKRDSSDCSLLYDTAAWYGYNLRYNWPGGMDEETMSAFGQLTIPLPAGFDFTAGVRYEKIYKEIDCISQVSRADTGEQMKHDPFAPGIALPVNYSMDDEWDALLPKTVLSWTMNRDVMLYASVAKGYLAGGFNRISTDKENAKFNEQSSINYEIGAKTAWFDNRLFLNSTFFYIDIKDMHVWNALQSGSYIASNAAEAHSQGIEIEAKARLLQGLDVTATAGWIDAEFDDYKKDESTDYSGKTTIQTPNYTFNMAVQYRHCSGIFVRGEMEGYGKTYYDEANTVSRDPYKVYNAKIGYEGLNWEVYIYAHNLSDTEYLSTMSCLDSGVMYMVGEPRNFGIITSVRF